jgi:quercetin dioxygenase-like cupin family protein
MNTQTPTDLPSTFLRKPLVTTQDIALVAGEWTQGHVSHLHHHDFSQCFVYIQEGEFENSLFIRGGEEKTTYRKGDVFTIP